MLPYYHHERTGTVDLICRLIEELRRRQATRLEYQDFATRIVQFLEPVEAVSAESEQFARFGHASQRSRWLQQSELVLDNPLFVWHLISPVFSRVNIPLVAY
jgi:hypothetical protein